MAGHAGRVPEWWRSHQLVWADLQVDAHARLLDSDTYRSDIKGIRNLQEGRHALAQRILHGRKGELFQRYHEGMEDQLGALGLVVDCVVLWNTYYIDLAIKQLRAEGHDVVRRRRRTFIAVHPVARERARHVFIQPTGHVERSPAAA